VVMNMGSQTPKEFLSSQEKITRKRGTQQVSSKTAIGFPMVMVSRGPIKARNRKGMRYLSLFCTFLWGHERLESKEKRENKAF